MHGAAQACRSVGNSRSGEAFGRLLRLVKKRERTRRRSATSRCVSPSSPRRSDASCLDRHFEAVGMSFVEMGFGWFAPIEGCSNASAIHGREHLDAALAAGTRRAACSAAHFTTLEVGVAVLEAIAPRASCMYRPQRNAMMDVMIRRGRSRFAREQIPRDNVRALLRNAARRLRRGLLAGSDLSRQAKRIAAVLRRARGDEHCDEQARGDQRRSGAAVFLPALAGTRAIASTSARRSPISRATTPRPRRARLFALLEELHSARARAVPVAVQEVQGPARAAIPTPYARRAQPVSSLASRE